jgi:MFS family permease
MQLRGTHETPLSGPTTGAPLGVREHLLLSVLWFALNFQYAALPAIVLPTQILLFFPSTQAGTADQAAALSWIVAAGACVALVAPPVVGTLSDRTWRPFGRRRPYIVLGAVTALVGALGMARARDLGLLVVGFLLVQAGGNGATAAYQGLLPDRVPETQRGTASGWLGLMTILGNVGSLALAGWLFRNAGPSGAARDIIAPGARVYYLLTGVALAVFVVVTILGVPERARPPDADKTEHVGRARGFAAMWIEPWRHRNFAWVFTTRGFVMLGVALFLTFIEYYFSAVLHITDFIGATAVVAAVALGGAVVSALALGILSDRVPRVPLVGLSTLCMALAALAFVLFPGAVPLWVLGILFGLGYGAYTSVDWALSIDALPSLSAAGKDLGLWAAAATLPTILAPLLGGIVISWAGAYGQTALGYRIVFALAALCLLLGAIFVRYIQEDRPHAG